MIVQEAVESELLTSLGAIIGQSYLLTDSESCSFYAQDVFTKDLPALAVAQPGNTKELALVVKTAVDAGHAVVARGGGMSYTSGYVPAIKDTVVIDLSRMNKVLEVNREDMYVTVESGCTWKDLQEGYRLTNTLLGPSVRY